MFARLTCSTDFNLLTLPFSSVTNTLPTEKSRTKQSRALSTLHWASAPLLIGSIGCVLTAQSAEKKDKGNWMWRHKSLGLLSFFVFIPRVAVKLSSAAPGMLKGSSVAEHMVAKVSHFGLYSFMAVMPVTGIAMGLFGGAGLPFFFTKIEAPKSMKNGAVAKQSFWLHKNIGYYGKFIVPLHVSAAGMHAARGHSIFARINPFAK